MIDYDQKDDEQVKHKIIQRHKELLQKLSDDRVVGVLCTDGEISLIECCDVWFSHSLTKEECIELSELFKELAEECKE